jgi:hypothetical protein
MPPGSSRADLPVIFAVAAAAATLGDNICFWISRTSGYRLPRRYGHYLRNDETRPKNRPAHLRRPRQQSPASGSASSSTASPPGCRPPGRQARLRF